MRKIMNKAGFGLLIAALSVGAIAFVDGFNLKRVPKEGDTVTYALKADVDVAGTEANFTAKVVEKVTKVQSDGNFIVESSQSEGKITFGGQEMEAPATSQTFTYKPTGEVLDIKAESVDSNVVRMANLQSFVVPDKVLNVNDDWAVELKKNDKTGAVNVKGTYKIVAEEKIGDFDCFKVTFNVKETEGGDQAASAEGTTWINKKDGTMVKADGKWINAPFPGAPGPINAHVTMTRAGVK